MFHDCPLDVLKNRSVTWLLQSGIKLPANISLSPTNDTFKHHLTFSSSSSILLLILPTYWLQCLQFHFFAEQVAVSVLIYAHILYLKLEYLPRRASGGSECGNRISGVNFLTVFHSNYESILLSFQDMTIGQTTDGQMTDHSRQPSHIWLLRSTSYNNRN